LLLVFGADSRRLQAGAFESSSIMLAPVSASVWRR